MAYSKGPSYVPRSVVLILIACSYSAFGSVDLGIKDDQTYKRPVSWSMNILGAKPSGILLADDHSLSASRPGISIAWRNANQVEEVEVGLQNLGNKPGEGRVFVDILDETGRPLLHLEPPDDQKIVRLPAVNLGGREGKVIRMKASWELNALIDTYDRSRTRYDVRATIETIGKDANPFDNSKTKSWNIPFRVRPGFLNAYNYIFKNYSGKTLKLKWVFEHTPNPPGWDIKGAPRGNTTLDMKPEQEIRGAMTMLAPNNIEENAFLEARLSLVDVATGNVYQQREWFQVFDTQPPDVSNYRVVLTDDHQIAIQALVADKGSGVLEATGVTTEYSVDGGKTWAAKAHNYKVGNFVRPTLFETVLGPFAPGTNVQLRFTAMDTGGNAQTIIPEDASAFTAPPNAQRLIQQAYLFPRNEANPVFELERLRSLKLDVDKLKSLNVDISKLDLNKPNALGLDPTQIKAVGLDPQRLADLKSDLAALGDFALDLNKIEPVPLKQVATPANDIIKRTTLEVQVK